MKRFLPFNLFFDKIRPMMWVLVVALMLSNIPAHALISHCTLQQGLGRTQNIIFPVLDILSTPIRTVINSLYYLISNTFLLCSDRSVHYPKIEFLSDIHESNLKLSHLQVNQISTVLKNLSPEKKSNAVCLIEDQCTMKVFKHYLDNTPTIDQNKWKESLKATAQLPIDWNDQLISGLTKKIAATGVSAYGLEVRSLWMKTATETIFDLNSSYAQQLRTNILLAQTIYDDALDTLQKNQTICATEKKLLTQYLEALNNRVAYYNEALACVIETDSRYTNKNYFDLSLTEQIELIDTIDKQLQKNLGNHWKTVLGKAHIHQINPELISVDESFAGLYRTGIIVQAALLDLCMLTYIIKHWDKEYIIIIAGLAHTMELERILADVFNSTSLISSSSPAYSAELQRSLYETLNISEQLQHTFTLNESSVINTPSDPSNFTKDNSKDAALQIKCVDSSRTLEIASSFLSIIKDEEQVQC